ncbi:MAG: 30S ribosomal protein S24e [Thermoplasmata archaeon]|jgi:small subunit ribosomal protein S24e|nr:MAG: 30S ribosomal protein S24e [Thermoplasmata archaeon]
MEIEIESRKENKLLEREEIYFRLKYEGATPSRKKIREQLKGMGIKGFIVIDHVKPLFGAREAKAYAKVYPSEQKARAIEPDYIIKRNVSGGKEEKESKEAKEGENE